MNSLAVVLSFFHHICPLMPSPTGTPPATDWKRPLGCPRRTWLQQVEEDMGLPISACQFATLDRSLWRSLRPLAGQEQQWVSEWLSCRFFGIKCTRLSVWNVVVTATLTRGRSAVCLNLRLHHSSPLWSRTRHIILICEAHTPTTRRPWSLPGNGRRRSSSAGCGSTGTAHNILLNRYSGIALFAVAAMFLNIGVT